MRQIRTLLLLVILYLPVGLNAQEDSSIKGIKWTTGLSWPQILERAKSENKYVFVDCYTTWCGPCKMMEKNVYPIPEVGDFFNKNFISVKFQMDKTDRDNDQVKKNYADAKKIEKEFFIDAYPTYLFLSPDGKPLHRVAGGFPPDKFIAVGKDALNPEKQSYTMEEKYDPEKMDTAELKKVALSYQYSDRQFASKMAMAYLNQFNDEQLKNFLSNGGTSFVKNFASDSKILKVADEYIFELDKSQHFSRDDAEFMLAFMYSSKSPAFQIFYKKNQSVNDAIVGKNDYKCDWAGQFVERMIVKEEVEPLLKGSQALTPNWKAIEKTVAKKYDRLIAERVIAKAKIDRAFTQNNFPLYATNITAYMERFGKYELDNWTLNQMAWDVFKYSTNKLELEKALQWSNKAVTIFPQANWMDTYANLLYKLGKRNTGILWEQAALKLEPGNTDFQNALEKMKKGLPTWPEQKD